MNNMIKLDCQWLQQQTFSNCTQVKTVSGEDAICVQTYNRWSDDSLLTFYIIQCGNKLLITDEAESIFHFRTVGLLENKRNWRGIQEKLNGTKTDIQLEQDGEIFTLCHPDRAATAIADFISALCAIMHYERELLALPAETCWPAAGSHGHPAPAAEHFRCGVQSSCALLYSAQGSEYSGRPHGLESWPLSHQNCRHDC